MKSTGEESDRADRPKMFYPILVKDGKFDIITDAEYDSLYDTSTNTFNDNSLNDIVTRYKALGFEVIIPYKEEGVYGRWRWGFENYKSNFSNQLIASLGRNGISIYKKQRPELGELPTSKPKSFFYKPEYSSGNGTAQIKALFGKNAFPYPKPEDLISDFITIGSNENDIVLDSFLGSGTTAAVATKMRRKFIGIEMGEHAYSLCFNRLKKVIGGNDPGGVTRSCNWKGGGGFKFYELAPSLLKKDTHGHMVINKEYNADMLAAAMAKMEGFTYEPSTETFWKQGHSSETDFIYTTTQFVTVESLGAILDTMADGESLLVCCKAFQPECKNFSSRISVKKIPSVLLGRCEFDHDDYSLNIIELPQTEEIDDSEDQDNSPESFSDDTSSEPSLF